MPPGQAQARFAFRKELPVCRQELIAKVIANGWVAFKRLGSPTARAKVTLLLEGTADGQ